MEIILMRHGRPALTSSEPLLARDMPDWITRYDLAGTGNDLPPEASRALADRAGIVISSDLPRALSSLKALGCEPMHTDALYREAERLWCGRAAFVAFGLERDISCAMAVRSIRPR